MTLEEKQAQDELTVRAYERKLRAKRKGYSQAAEAISEGGRKNRALALGECCLQAMEKLRRLSAEHQLLPGTLFWNINEQHVKDTDGKKGYLYSVVYYVRADEQALTEEEIAEEVETTRKQIEQETLEMFAEEAPEDAEPPWIQ